MDISTARAAHAAAQARYRATAKGRLTDYKHSHSDKGRARYHRYRATERGALLRRIHDTSPLVYLRKRLYMQEARGC